MLLLCSRIRFLHKLMPAVALCALFSSKNKRREEQGLEVLC